MVFLTERTTQFDPGEAACFQRQSEARNRPKQCYRRKHYVRHLAAVKPQLFRDAAPVFVDSAASVGLVLCRSGFLRYAQSARKVVYSMRLPRFCSLFVGIVTMACTNGGGAKPAASTAEKPTGAAATVESAQPSDVPKADAKPALTQVPAVDLSGLAPKERDAFLQILNEEICPCGCPQSFAGCLQENSRCEAGAKLANWAADQLRQGLPTSMIAEMLAEESVAFSAAPKTIQVEGFAQKGAASPKYQLVEYADFECGHCKSTAPVLDVLVKKYPESVQVVFKHFPLSFHTQARRAAAAAEAAGMQGRFWEMHNAIFATQNMLSDELILGHAKAIGLDVEKFRKDWNAPSTVAKVEQSRAEGEELGVQATPAVYVNGRAFSLMRALDALELRLEMEASRATSTCQ